MRPVTQKFNPGREPRLLKVVPKYIFVTEGYLTEQIYLNALRENRGVVGISGLLEIVLLQREPIDSGLSHPRVLLELLDKYMRCVRHRRYSQDLVLEVVCNAIWVKTGITAKDPRMDAYRREVLEGTAGLWDDDGFTDRASDVLETCTDKASEMFGIAMEVSLPELMEYRPDTDSICIVVDRDRDNRDSRSIDEFIRGCRRRGYRPIISNPCFEVWLMMHFDAFDRIDRRTLLLNPMEDGKRYTERELDRIVRGVRPENSYSKDDFDPGMFMHRVPEAVRRSMGMCHNPQCLKKEPGTNLGELVNEMSSTPRQSFDRASLVSDAERSGK